MPKSFRVRTEIGKEKNLTFELKQDFDLLEILSLSLTQQDVYSRMCSDFGVVVGRVISNGGFGIPNAKVSIFVPLDSEDETNPIIKQLYPYTQPYDKDEQGKRYNLLSSEENFDCHVPVGTFPKLRNVLSNQDVRYVYDKYYKFTVKTNESGDFMIYGVPTGDQNIVMDVDLSDIGCFSLLPEDFKQMGYSSTDFDGPKFKSDSSIDSLPQILNQTKSIDVRPFWGDEELCNASITRVDFDLQDSGFKLKPMSIFMGSTATDTDKDAVNFSCRPRRAQGNLCSLVSQPGLIDAIRYTPFFKQDSNAYTSTTSPGLAAGGTVPILERYYLEDGGRVIDSTGAFLVHLPMNLDHVITDEFGNLVKSQDPEKGVPTRGRYRFRIRPEQSAGTARNRRRGSYLVPNIREYNDDVGDSSDGNWTSIDPKSYAFSIEYSDYHPHAQTNLLPGALDYFYDMTFNRVYTVSQFHDHVKHNGRRQFLGVKEILPEEEQQCSTTAVHFPVNSAVRRAKFIIYLNNLLIDLMGIIFMAVSLIVGILSFIFGIILLPILLFLYALCAILILINDVISSLPWVSGPLDGLIAGLGCDCICVSGSGCFACGPGNVNCAYFGFPLGFVLFTLRQTKYPECEKCTCRNTANSEMQALANNFPCPGAPPTYDSSDCEGGFFSSLAQWGGNDCCGAQDEARVCCPDWYGFDSTTTVGGLGDVDGPAGGGCYVKVMCFNPACILANLSMTTFFQWARRQKIASALCNGVMNYFWENAWVSGFLYQFQFKMKLKYSVADDSYNADSKWCKKLVYIHPSEHVVYYRSTPFKWDSATNTGYFLGDEDGVRGGNSSSDKHSDGDMRRHILFPTTIVDMGSRNQCIQQICLDPNFAEECSVTDQIGHTSFQDFTELVSDIYNLKANYSLAALGSFFTRPENEIGGDVAQAIMQNCMVGVVGYESNMSTTGCVCLDDNGNSGINTGTTLGELMEYPYPGDGNSPFNDPYVQHGVYGDGARRWIQWEPMLFTAATQTIMSGVDLIECLTEDLRASSQPVPYYIWNLDGAPGTPFGSDYNDWSGTYGDYRRKTAIPMSPLGAINLGPVSTNIWPEPNPLTSDYFQGSNAGTMGVNNSLLQPANYPPLTPTSSPTINMTQPLFYYFGLRPGQTSYNTFLRLYVDEELADAVL